MKYVNETNHIVIQGWMRNILELKGTDLMVYAIIYGFSQQDGHWFNGSLQYLADWTGTSKQCCINSLKRLMDRQLIQKEEILENGVKYCRYSKKFNGIQKSLIPGIQKSLTNNINNINIINQNNIPSNNSIKSNSNLEVNNINIDKRKTRKQLKQEQEIKNQNEINNLIDNYTNNANIKELLNQYIEVRKQRGLTSAQFRIILDDLKKECGNDVNHTINCIRKAIAGGWSQIVFANSNYKSKNVDNTSNHFTGNAKITDEELDTFTFEEKKHYISKMALADMTDKQRQFFNQYCLARDENGNLLEF